MKNDQRRLRDRVAVFACIAIAAITIDQLTKMWALSALADGRTIRVIPGLLSLTLVRNPGASLGMGSGMTWLISLLAMAACVALVVLAVRTISMKWTVLFAFAFAGWRYRRAMQMTTQYRWLYERTGPFGWRERSKA